MSAALVCPCHHHKVLPAIVVLIGISFLLKAFDVIDSDVVAFIWPVLLIGAGLFKLKSSGCECCDRG